MPLTDADRELLDRCRVLCGPPAQDWNIPFMAMKCRDHMPKVLEIIDRLEAELDDVSDQFREADAEVLRLERMLDEAEGVR